MISEVTLKEFIEDHLAELERSIDRRFACVEALVIAGVAAHQREHAQIDTQRVGDAHDVSRRLDAMNDLRAQMSAERGLFVTRALLDSQLQSVSQQLTDLGGRIEQQARLMADIQGRFWMAGTFLTFLSVLVSLALKFFSGK